MGAFTGRRLPGLKTFYTTGKTASGIIFIYISYTLYHIYYTVEATKIRITVVDSGKAASFVDLTHINAFRRGVIVIGNK